MRKLRTALLAGAGALFAAGAAVAAEKYDHVMNVALPDGSVAQVHYEGKVAPRIVVTDAPVQRVVLADPFAMFDGPSFADFDRMVAMMEQQRRQMMLRVAGMQAQMADALRQARSQTSAVAATSGAPPANGPQSGFVQYSFVSTTNSDGCTTSVQWSSDGAAAEPKVIRTSSGACGAKAEEVKPARVTAATPKAEARPQAIPGAKRT